MGIMNQDVEKLIADLQEWARGKFGEAEYEYSAHTHSKRQHRTPRGRKSGDPYYMVTREVPITREEYEANWDRGREDHAAVFFGRRQPFEYVTYERKMIKKGWRELLPALLIGNDTDTPPKAASDEPPPF